MAKRALICGISGQDGTYLAKLLLDRGYEVWGSSRDAELATFDNLRRLGIYESVRLVSLNLRDVGSVLGLLRRVRPDEVFSLAGQSSVGLSFEQPVESKVLRLARLACWRQFDFPTSISVFITRGPRSALATRGIRLPTRSRRSIPAAPMRWQKPQRTGP
jgi:nucleoside-diphosphate-sugar epimerase